MAVKTMIEAIRDGLREEMESDDRVFVMGEDVGPRGGVFGVTDGFFKQWCSIMPYATAVMCLPSRATTALPSGTV